MLAPVRRSFNTSGRRDHRPRACGSTRAALPAIAPTWLTPEGRLDPTRLLDAFVAFWRQHGEPLLGTSPYHEVAPHIVLMAFLHRVVNGGGRIYACATDRIRWRSS
jgi:hypothetical protein